MSIPTRLSYLICALCTTVSACATPNTTTTPNHTQLPPAHEETTNTPTELKTAQSSVLSRAESERARKKRKAELVQRSTLMKLLGTPGRAQNALSVFGSGGGTNSSGALGGLSGLGAASGVGSSSHTAKGTGAGVGVVASAQPKPTLQWTHIEVNGTPQAAQSSSDQKRLRMVQSGLERCLRRIHTGTPLAGYQASFEIQLTLQHGRVQKVETDQRSTNRPLKKRDYDAQSACIHTWLRAPRFPRSVKTWKAVVDIEYAKP